MGSEIVLPIVLCVLLAIVAALPPQLLGAAVRVIREKTARLRN